MRRYIAALQALDIPVEGQRGVGGGYRVRPGYRLPPLMLNDDEAVAVVLGLIGARGSTLDGEAEPVDGALAQDPARAAGAAAHPGGGARADARLHGGAASGAPVGGGVALLLADAIRRRRRVRIAYRSFSGERAGASSARTASSCTPAAGTSPPTTTRATTCARSASIA